MSMDHRFIEINQGRIESALDKRNYEFDLTVMNALIAKRKSMQKEHDEKAALANEQSKSIGKLFQQGASKEEIEKAKQDSQALKEEVHSLAQGFEGLDADIKEKLLFLPNILHESVVSGKGEEDNQLVRTWGEPKELSFSPKTHDELGQSHGILNFEEGAKISGSRFTVMHGFAAKLERALVNFMLDTHSEAGYEEVSVPFLVNANSMRGTGQLPKFAQDAFQTKDPEYFLIPTAEVPVTNIFQNEVLDEKNFPKSFVAYSPCFRKEAGSYGKDTKGLIRQHQFHKVELMRFVEPEKSYQALDELTGQAELILQKLELPYRVMSLCSGDIGFSAAKTFDIEVWLPGQNKYREISSCSNFEDFQARRANIRFKSGPKGKPGYVHTLNGSGLAIGRTMVALFENYQQADGSIKLPKILSQYMGGMLELGPL